MTEQEAEFSIGIPVNQTISEKGVETDILFVGDNEGCEKLAEEYEEMGFKSTGKTKEVLLGKNLGETIRNASGISSRSFGFGKWDGCKWEPKGPDNRPWATPKDPSRN